MELPLPKDATLPPGSAWCRGRCPQAIGRSLAASASVAIAICARYSCKAPESFCCGAKTDILALPICAKRGIDSDSDKRSTHSRFCFPCAELTSTRQLALGSLVWTQRRSGLSRGSEFHKQPNYHCVSCMGGLRI